MTRSDHAINGKMFNRLNKVSKEHEVELVTVIALLKRKLLYSASGWEYRKEI